MFAWLVLGLVGFAIWKLGTRRSAFVDRFASLLEEPVFGRRSLLRGRQHVGGKFQGNAVTLLVQPKGDEDLGYLVVATEARTPFSARIGRRSRATRLVRALGMAPGSPLGDAELDERFLFDVADAAAVRAWIRDESVRRSVEALVDDYDLSLAIEDGLVKASWMPVGFFTFPGRFEPERWRSVLENMHVLTRSLH